MRNLKGRNWRFFEACWHDIIWSWRVPKPDIVYIKMISWVFWMRLCGCFLCGSNIRPVERVWKLDLPNRATQINCYTTASTVTTLQCWSTRCSLLCKMSLMGCPGVRDTIDSALACEHHVLLEGISEWVSNEDQRGINEEYRYSAYQYVGLHQLAGAQCAFICSWHWHYSSCSLNTPAARNAA